MRYRLRGVEGVDHTGLWTAFGTLDGHIEGIQAAIKGPILRRSCKTAEIIPHGKSLSELHKFVQFYPRVRKHAPHDSTLMLWEWLHPVMQAVQGCSTRGCDVWACANPTNTGNQPQPTFCLSLAPPHSSTLH